MPPADSSVTSMIVAQISSLLYLVTQMMARPTAVGGCVGQNNCIQGCFDGAETCYSPPTSGGPWALIYVPGTGYDWFNMGAFALKGTKRTS